jgi:SAM-dependent methyltransferase
MKISKPYESDTVRAVTGPTIRPGGLALTSRAADYCGLGPGDRVLDIGCGSGATTVFLTAEYDASVIGIDLSRLLLAEARNQHPMVGLIRGSAMALPVKADVLSAVYCECVCSLLPDTALALKGFYRVLQPGGHLAIADLYWRTPDDALTVDPMATGGGCLAGAVDRNTMVRRIEAAGFKIDLWEDHSETLKQLAAQLAWAGVSLTEWWGIDRASGSCNSSRRPGYCLIVARKREEPNG